ncbi:MAG: galactokinase [Isosphaeraceae bacterium]
MPTAPLETAARDAFGGTFGGAPAVVARAPGRVELLGNHTDYNGGLVLAAAIDRFTVVAGRAVEAPRARVRSVQFDQEDDFPVAHYEIERGEPGSWHRYVRGVVWALTEFLGHRGGFEAAVVGDVPLGGGLSSSASLQASLARFLIASGVVDDPSVGDPAFQRIKPERADELLMYLAQALQHGENDFVGVSSGLLDQFAVLFGRAGHALMLDCATLEFRRLPLGPNPPAIVVCDSRTSRRLADGMYNQRREECWRVVRFYQDRRGGEEAVPWLRLVSLDELKADWDALDPVGRLRARHVLTENDRVLKGARLLKEGDVAGFGRLMSASHASSRDDFGNSSPALDALIEAAEESPGFLGGKLSGAGWAGCTVNLVTAGQAEAFAASVSEGYARRTGLTPEIHVCHAADGASASRL